LIPKIAPSSYKAIKLAQEFGRALIPFKPMFDQAVKQAPPAYWASDAVRPAAGYMLMAKVWMEHACAVINP
jgi:hypothetical protein